MVEKVALGFETSPESVQENISHRPNAAEAAKNHPRPSLEKIRRQVAEEAIDSDDYVDTQGDEATHLPTQAYANKELKKIAYKRWLKRARKQLPFHKKLFSQLVHQSSVEMISELAAETIGRPSGVLGGGILALAGSLAYYYIAKHYGYEYNFLLFVLLLAAGFVVGCLIELFYKMFRARPDN